MDARDRGAAGAALEAAGYTVASLDGEGPLRLSEARAVDAPEAVAQALVAAGTPPTRLAVEQEDLEQHFLRLTGRGPMKRSTFAAGQAALWAEFLKARRSQLPWLAALGFSFVPLVGGLFMIILKDPQRAQSMGLISAKAQLQVGVADWPALLWAVGPGHCGGRRRAVQPGDSLDLRARVFRPYGQGTVGHAYPARRHHRGQVRVPGRLDGVLTGGDLRLGLWWAARWACRDGPARWLWRAAGDLAATTLLTLALMPPVALLASAGRGYLPPLGWAMLTVFLAQIVAATGWGDWFPWAVPALFSGLAGPRSVQLGLHSYMLVGLTSSPAWPPLLAGGAAPTRPAEKVREE